MKSFDTSTSRLSVGIGGKRNKNKLFERENPPSIGQIVNTIRCLPLLWTSLRIQWTGMIPHASPGFSGISRGLPQNADIISGGEGTGTKTPALGTNAL